ncbi:MAG: hypothetical protein NZZ41_00395 [Candidatus Dojkabacteria bacterium]|nr:hypothetical protein [Candidatus Dojkabacteria bacterium]
MTSYKLTENFLLYDQKDLKNMAVFRKNNLHFLFKDIFFDILDDQQSEKFIVLNDKRLNIEDFDDPSYFNIVGFLKDRNFENVVSFTSCIRKIDNILMKSKNKPLFHLNFGRFFNPWENQDYYNNTLSFNLREFNILYDKNDIFLVISNYLEKCKENKNFVFYVDLSIFENIIPYYIFNDSFDDDKKYKYSDIYRKLNLEKFINVLHCFKVLRKNNEFYYIKPNLQGVILDSSNVMDYDKKTVENIFFEIKVLLDERI